MGRKAQWSSSHPKAGAITTTSTAPATNTLVTTTISKIMMTTAANASPAYLLTATSVATIFTLLTRLPTTRFRQQPLTGALEIPCSPTSTYRTVTGLAAATSPLWRVWEKPIRHLPLFIKPNEAIIPITTAVAATRPTDIIATTAITLPVQPISTTTRTAPLSATTPMRTFLHHHTKHLYSNFPVRRAPSLCR